jgi:hypothetical protein
MKARRKPTRSRLLRAGTSRAPAALIACLIALCILVPQQSHARLPRATVANGTILAIDVESKTLVFKPQQGKKPFLLEWNNETEFSNGGKPTTPKQVTSPAPATIQYKDLTFRHPLLKKVAVTNSVHTF